MVFFAVSTNYKNVGVEDIVSDINNIDSTNDVISGTTTINTINTVSNELNNSLLLVIAALQEQVNDLQTQLNSLSTSYENLTTPP